VESLGALRYIKEFEKMKFKDKQRRMEFVITILLYCSENTSIRVQGPPLFFTSLIYNELARVHHSDP
jgi:hypothetical protein